MSISAAKLRARRERVENDHRLVLKYWHEISGQCLGEFAEVIEREQPGGHPSDFMGVGPGVMLFLESSPAWGSLHDVGKIPVLRSVQHLICTRPWRHSPSSATEPEPDLFGSAEAGRA